MDAASLIAGISALAYVLAYAYEIGFGKEFRIPTELISVGINDVVAMGGGLLLVGFFILGIVDMGFRFRLLTIKKTRPVLQTFLKAVFWTLIPILGLAMAGVTLEEAWWAYAASIGFGIAGYFLSPLMTQKGKGSYVEKLHLENEKEKERASVPAPLVKFLWGRFNRATVAVIFLLPLLAASAYAAGKLSAVFRSEYSVVGGNPERVILRRYGDEFVCATFDRTTHIVQSGYTLLKSPDADLASIRVEDVGPLRLSKTANSNP